MLRKFYNNIVNKMFGTSKKEESSWLLSVNKHSCNGGGDVVGCDACSYNSLKIGGFSDVCIELIMTGSFIELPKSYSPNSIIESTDDTVKRISNAHDGINDD